MIGIEKAFDSVAWPFICIQKALEFFNFAPDMKRLINAFYKTANTCISLNGQFPGWFDLQRGIRQGDPLLPYLYLICAEIVSSMLRENKKIKGITLKEKEILLKQFADDTTLFLDGSERSFNESIWTLQNRHGGLVVKASTS